MPVIRTPSVPFGPKGSLSPYDISYHCSRFEKNPIVKIQTTVDYPYPGHISTYDGFEDSPFPLSPWMNVGPLYPEPEVYESVPCLPSLTLSPSFSENSYEEPLDGSLLNWSYEGSSSSSYDSLTVVPDISSHSNSFSPTLSLVSNSPRSEHSASLSPQPPEFSHGLKFNYPTPPPLEFPSSSSPVPSPSILPVGQSPKQSKSTSCSSVDAVEKKKPSKSRDTSPSRPPENDARRRFPCLILGCERRFTSQYTLKVHMEAHKPKPRISFPCTLGCNERFSRQHDRLRHEVAKHGKVCEFSCEECGRFFSTRKTLGNHKCPVAQGGTRWVTN